jgi:hypothetical protein
MTVGADGLVTWKPTTLGFFDVILRVTDGAQTYDQPYTIQVIKGLTNGLRPADLRELVRSPARLALASRPLRAGQLAPEARRSLADASIRRALAYVVACALDEGDVLRLRAAAGPLVLEGRLGLAPEWRRRPCHRRCQEQVSACVAARVNVEGAAVPILFASHAASRRPVGHTEGAFFGNLFANPPHLLSCRARQASPPVRGRRCTVDRSGVCRPVRPVGDCEDVCEGAGYRSCRAPEHAGRRSPAITVILP